VSSRLLAWVGFNSRLIPAPRAYDDIIFTVAAITMMHDDIIITVATIMRFIILKSPVKPCPVKYFKWLLKVIKEQRAGKGYILFLDQTAKGILDAQWAMCPLVEA